MNPTEPTPPLISPEPPPVPRPTAYWAIPLVLLSPAMVALLLSWLGGQESAAWAPVWGSVVAGFVGSFLTLRGRHMVVWKLLLLAFFLVPLYFAVSLFISVFGCALGGAMGGKRGPF